MEILYNRRKHTWATAPSARRYEMRIREKDYKYLLLNLIPRHRLSVDRRRQIDRAIAGGVPEEIRHVAIRALEDLCQGEYFTRGEAVAAEGQLAVTYRRPSGSYHLRVLAPASEWEDQRPVTETPQAPVQESPAPPQVAASDPLAVEIIPDLLRSLSINGEGDSTLARLDAIMAVLPEWLSFVAGRLVLVEERLNGHRETPSPNVRLAAERVLLQAPAYDQSRRSGRVDYVDGVAAATLGLEPPPEVDEAQLAEYTVAIAPISPLGQFWGALDIWVRGSDESTMRDRVDLASGTVSKIIENVVKLENLTSVDKLTGIYNRGFYDVQVRIEIERATRQGTELTMLIVDIDDFKKINDSMGHRKGDEGLAIVAELMRHNLRKIDLPFRYGGEEFVILLPGTGKAEAIHTAERLRMVVAESEALRDFDDKPVALRVSIGAAVFPVNARSEEELFSKADSALYKAKSSGKNRVEFYNE